MRERRGLAMLLTVVGIALFCAAIAAALWSLHGTPTLVFGDFVPRRWHGLAALLVLAALSLLAARRVSPQPPRTRQPARPLSLAVGAAVATGLLATGAAALTAAVAVSDSISDYHLLKPASAGGCRVLVEERSALLLGSGTVYLLPAGARVARETNSYSADDGYRPITFGTYSLRWRGETAHLELKGTQHQPVEFDPQPMTC